jgi:hypothetical protein
MANAKRRIFTGNLIERWGDRVLAKRCLWKTAATNHIE